MCRRGGKERWTRMTHRPQTTSYPPLALFRLQCIHLNQDLWRGRTPLCVPRHCDDTCSECCATYVRAVERNLFLSNARNTPAALHILPQTSACGDSCALPPGMRHEDELVCSPSYDACEGRPLISRIARHPGVWRSAVASEVG